jgi:hypothetical protein
MPARMNCSAFGSRMMSWSGSGSPSNTAAMTRWLVVVMPSPKIASISWPELLADVPRDDKQPFPSTRRADGK